jgi:hypothetical protein
MGRAWTVWPGGTTTRHVRPGRRRRRPTPGDAPDPACRSVSGGLSPPGSSVSGAVRAASGPKCRPRWRRPLDARCAAYGRHQPCQLLSLPPIQPTLYQPDRPPNPTCPTCSPPASRLLPIHLPASHHSRIPAHTQIASQAQPLNQQLRCSTRMLLVVAWRGAGRPTPPAPAAPRSVGHNLASVTFGDGISERGP